MILTECTPGKRVATHPATDAWMQGDRYGSIVRRTGENLVQVRMERSGRVRTFSPDNLIEK